MLEAKNLEKQILLKKIDNQTLNIKIFDNKLLLAIVGEFNNNLSELEKLTNTKLFFRGNSITAKGDEDSILKVSESFKFLVNKFLITNSIENSDIIYSIKNSMSNTEQNNKNKNSVGKFKEVLVENKLKNQTKYFGRTHELTPVIFDTNKEDVGKVIEVEIKKYNRNTLFGSKITSKKEAAA